MTYASIENLKTVDIPTVDVTVGKLMFKLAALTRAQLKWAMDKVGWKPAQGGNPAELIDAEEADLLMLASCMIEPPLDAESDDHLALLRGLPIGDVTKLTDAMMKLSGMRKQDPTKPIGG